MMLSGNLVFMERADRVGVNHGNTPALALSHS